MEQANSVELDINHYLDAAADASKRTRTVILTIVVASVLTFAGFLNSIDHNWMLQRVRAMAVPGSDYLRKKFPEATDADAIKQSHDLFYDALMKSYVNNSYTVHVPFFGVSFDVNDLALLSGVAFIILLVLFRFCLARELDNLGVGFERAKKDQRLDTFYHLLAMRQVLTTPAIDWPASPGDGRDLRRPGLMVKIVPKSLSILPALVLAVVIIHDFATSDYGNAVSAPHTLVLYISSAVLFTLVSMVSVSAIRVWVDIDKCWKRYWKEVGTIKNQSAVRLMPARGDQSNLAGVSQVDS